ncbi:hypothetical protein [Fusibacter bizertensis]
MRTFRKFDYIISFLFFVTLSLVQAIEIDAKRVITAGLISLLASAIVGTITNIVLKRKTEN